MGLIVFAEDYVSMAYWLEPYYTGQWVSFYSKKDTTQVVDVSLIHWALQFGQDHNHVHSFKKLDDNLCQIIYNYIYM